MGIRPHSGLRRVARLTIHPRIWFRCLTALLISILRRLLWSMVGRPIGNPEETLFVVKNSLSVFYALEYARLLSERVNSKCAITAMRRLRPEIEKRANEESISIRFTPLHKAMFGKWRLTIYTHHYLGFCFDQTTPSVYVSHGIETGKKEYYDTVYTYGFKGMITPWKPIYQTMIATHAMEIDNAAREYASYRGVVTTSTNAVLERLLLRAEQKTSLKARVELTDGRPVVLFMSTWGHPSLMSSHGKELAQEIESLGKDFHLVFSVHPKLANSKRAKSILRSLLANGAKVIPPTTSWIDYMAVSDVAVSDITSMCLYSALLGIPTVFVDPPLHRLIPGGLVEELVRHSPQARSVRDLKPRLWDALHRPNIDVLKRLRSQFPHLGHAAHLAATIESTRHRQDSLRSR